MGKRQVLRESIEERIFGYREREVVREEASWLLLGWRYFFGLLSEKGWLGEQVFLRKKEVLGQRESRLARGQDVQGSVGNLEL